MHIKSSALNFRNFAYLSAFALIFFTLIISSDIAAEAALDGLKTSALVLVPSLFPLSVVSGMLVRLKIAESICVYLGKPFKKLFLISENAVLPFLLGLAGGYPLGILTAADMYKNARISLDDLKKLCCFCSNCSPSFIFAVAVPHFCTQAAFSEPAKIALMLFCTHILSAMFSGIIFTRLISKSETALRDIPNPLKIKSYTFTSALTESVESSAIGMLRLSAYISLFYMFNRLILSSDVIIIKVLTNIKYMPVLISGILEFSTGVLSLGADSHDIALCAFFISFGGLCVAMQSASILKDTGIKIRYYIFSKLFQGITAYVIVYIIVYFCRIL